MSRARGRPNGRGSSATAGGGSAAVKWLGAIGSLAGPGAFIAFMPLRSTDPHTLMLTAYTASVQEDWRPADPHRRGWRGGHPRISRLICRDGMSVMVPTVWPWDGTGRASLRMVWWR